MLQHTMKAGLIVVVLGLLVQDAGAFGHRGGWGCGYGGCGGCGYGGCGYGGWGYGSYGYGGGYGGWYGGYAASPSGSYSATSATPATALLTVSVPADAKVFVNDQPTRTTGAYRRYTCTGLAPSMVYAYRVRAEFTRDGKAASEEKTVRLGAGQTGSLVFSAAPKTQVAGTNSETARRN
jgi:uncharacterized protein (TIGR03000 family)